MMFQNGSVDKEINKRIT